MKKYNANDLNALKKTFEILCFNKDQTLIEMQYINEESFKKYF